MIFYTPGVTTVRDSQMSVRKCVKDPVEQAEATFVWRGFVLGASCPGVGVCPDRTKQAANTGGYF